MRTVRTQRAFTLVELMVVVGIIALLIGILLPVLGRVRDMAARTACASNQRQLINCVVMYTQDWKGTLPFSNFDVNGSYTPPWKTGWLYTSPYNVSLNPPTKNLETGALWPYLTKSQSGSTNIVSGVSEIFRCPSDKIFSNNSTDFKPVQKFSSYVMNGAVTAYAADTPYKITKMKNGTIAFWEADESGVNAISYFNDGSNFPWEGITSRHRGGGTVVYFDGHGGWMSKKEFTAYAGSSSTSSPTKPAPNILWANPGSTNGK